MSAHTFTLLSLSSRASPQDLRNFNGACLIPSSSDKLTSFLIGKPLSIRQLNPNRIVLKRKSTLMAISLNLPTTIKREDISATEMPKWSARAIRSFALAELEARKLKYLNTGTEALLLGIMVEGTSQAAKFLRDNGFRCVKLREVIVNLIGKSGRYLRCPERPPLTETAKKVLDWVVEEKLKSGEGGEITVAHLLYALWTQDCAAHYVMESFGFNDEKAEELKKFMDKDVVMSHHK